MAKVIGPLFSQEARGQFGKSLVFTRRRGQNVVRGYVVPANPQTASQITTRIAFAVSGIITRRVSGGRLTFADATQTIVQFWTGLIQTGEVWNSALVGAVSGPGFSVYNAAVTTYAALPANTRTAWATAAATAIVNLPDYTRGDVTIDKGFMLYLLQSANATAGYQPLLANSMPNVLISAPVA